ncbi:hypothetical protein [Saccharopolyspora sp. NPDC002376]
MNHLDLPDDVRVELVQFLGGNPELQDHPAASLLLSADNCCPHNIETVDPVG